MNQSSIENIAERKTTSPTITFKVTPPTKQSPEPINHHDEETTQPIHPKQKIKFFDRCKELLSRLG